MWVHWRSKVLTDNDCRNAKFGVPIKKTGEIKNKRFDGGRLYLQLTPTGSKLWRLAYRIANPRAGQEGQKDKLERTFYIDGAYPAASPMPARKLPLLGCW
jgi:hypothetical protein